MNCYPGKFNKASIFVTIFFWGTSIAVAQKSQWQPIGPWGAKVEELAVFSNDSNILYAHGMLSLFQSTDGGRNWREVIDELSFDDYPIDIWVKLAVHPLQSNTIYLSSASALRKSEDGGQTWTTILDSLGFVFDEVTFNPSNTDILYVNSLDKTIEDQINGGGLFRSDDSGLTWHYLNTPFSEETVTDFKINPADTSMLYVTTISPDRASSSILKSSNAGKDWISAYTDSSRRLISVELSRGNPSVLYVNYDEVGTGRGGIIKSINQGENWSILESNLPAARIRNLAIGPTNENEVLAAIGGSYLDQNSEWQQDFGLYNSIDGGINWQRIGQSMEDSLFLDIEFDLSNPDIIFVAASLFGVYATNDGGASWEPRNGGDLHRISGPFALNNVDVDQINLAMNMGILRTENGGQTWKRAVSFPVTPLNFAIATASEANLFYAAYEHKTETFFLKSDNGGKTWVSKKNSVLRGFKLNLHVSPENPDVIFGTSWSGAFKTTDGGETWFEINLGLTTTLVNSLAFNPVRPNTIYIGTSRGVFKSTKGGDDWEKIGADESDVESIAVAIADTNMLFSATSSFLSDFGRLRRSNNGGVTWMNIDMPNNEEVSDFLLDPNMERSVYAATFDESILTSNIFFSDDDGQNWVSVNEGLPSSRVEDLHLTSSSSLFVLNTNGLYKQDFSTSVPTQANQPSSYILFPNYPNPFNPIIVAGGAGNEATTISYQLNKPAEVEIAIYNILGQSVANLLRTTQGIGEHKVYWDGRATNNRFAPPGVYFIRLRTADTLLVRKMLLTH